ncbi:MAG: hypothetical protein RLZZ490_2508, partial [Cyanobacteriota bacterium]
RGVALVSTGIIYLQCLLGALVGSQWAAHQCLAIAGHPVCQVLHSHLLGILPTAIGVGATLWCTGRTPALNPLLRQLGLTAAALFSGQILLGVATLKLHLQIEPLTVAHHSVGICLWGTLLAIAVLAIRDHRDPVSA